MKWFQILLCITNNTIKHQSFVYTQLNDQTVLFLTIQVSISHLFTLSLNVKQFYLTDRTLLGVTTTGQSGPGSNSNKKLLLHIPKAPVLLEPLSDYLVLYPGNLLEGGLTPLERCSWCILLGYHKGWYAIKKRNQTKPSYFMLTKSLSYEINLRTSRVSPSPSYHILI